jgi:SAM-dependent methyltransferase
MARGLLGNCRPWDGGHEFLRLSSRSGTDAKARPFFHPLAVRKIQATCCENGPIDWALDVGCGTGQSTMALLEVAEQIIGLDSSAEMLSHAVHHERIRFVEAHAEQMPFADAVFGLMTVALAFHWLDQQKFLLEAQRLLRPGGWLVIYNDVFTGRMSGNDTYAKWNRDEYLARYPTPPRNSQPLDDLDVSEYRFEPAGFNQFIHEVEFTPDQLVSYLLTQTNVISAIEAGRKDLQSVATWLLESVQRLFSKAKEKFSFSCQMRFLKRI